MTFHGRTSGEFAELGEIAVGYGASEQAFQGATLVTALAARLVITTLIASSTRSRRVAERGRQVNGSKCVCGSWSHRNASRPSIPWRDGAFAADAENVDVVPHQMRDVGSAGLHQWGSFLRATGSRPSPHSQQRAAGVSWARPSVQAPQSQLFGVSGRVAN